MSGGRSSAYGFLYQYLATADYFLHYLSADDVDPADVALLVEPTAITTRDVGNDQDIVDCAIENKGVVVERVQVKGSSDPPSNRLHLGDAGDVMRRLGASPVGVNHLLTNRPLSTGLAEQCTLVESARSWRTPVATGPMNVARIAAAAEARRAQPQQVQLAVLRITRATGRAPTRAWSGWRPPRRARPGPTPDHAAGPLRVCSKSIRRKQLWKGLRPDLR